MSGHKRALVTLSESDLRKLSGVEDRLRQVEHDYHSIRQRARHEQDAVLLQGLQALQSRQERLQEALSGLDTGLAQVEAQASQRLLEQAGYTQAALDEQLTSFGAALWQDTSALLEAQQSQLHSLLAEGQAARQEQLLHLEARLHDGWQQRTQLAEQALLSASALLSALEATPSFETAFPSQAAAFHASLELAHSDLASGLPEAALSLSQQAYLCLSQLSAQLEARLWQRSCLLASALAAAQAALERTHQLSQVPAVDLDGQTLPISLDLDFWSAGLYAQVLSELQALVQQLSSGAPDLDDDQLSHLLASRLPALEHDLDEAVFQARRSVLASQLRFNLAECVVHALAEQGFSLQGGGYLAADPREPYQAQVRHFDGSEVLVQVAPVPEQAGMSQVDLHSLDTPQRSEHELRQRAREIALSLQAYGLQVGRSSPSAETAYPHVPPLTAPSRQLAEQQVRYGRD